VKVVLDKWSVKLKFFPAKGVILTVVEPVENVKVLEEIVPAYTLLNPTLAPFTFKWMNVNNTKPRKYSIFFMLDFD